MNRRKHRGWDDTDGGGTRGRGRDRGFGLGRHEDERDEGRGHRQARGARERSSGGADRGTKNKGEDTRGEK